MYVHLLKVYVIQSRRAKFCICWFSFTCIEPPETHNRYDISLHWLSSNFLGEYAYKIYGGSETSLCHVVSSYSGHQQTNRTLEIRTFHIFLSATSGEDEIRGVQMVSICNHTSRCHLI